MENSLNPVYIACLNVGFQPTPGSESITASCDQDHVVRGVPQDRCTGNIPGVCGRNRIPAITAVFSNLT